MTNPAGMVCTSYEGGTVCADVTEYTNAQRDQALLRNAEVIQIRSVDFHGRTVKVLGQGKDPYTLWTDFATDPPNLSSGVAGYAFYLMSNNVFPKSPIKFDNSNDPLVGVPGRAIVLDGGQILLGALDLCGLEIVEIEGKLRSKRLLAPGEWTQIACVFGITTYSDGQPRKYCEQPTGTAVTYDMNQGVYEWTYDLNRNLLCIGGAPQDYHPNWLMRVNQRNMICPDDPNFTDDHLGFRCGASSKDPPIETE